MKSLNHLDWLRLYGDFEAGTPSQHTIARVMRRFQANNFKNCLLSG